MAKEAESPVVKTPPNPSDYLPESIKKAVFQTGLKHPVTIYPVALGLSCGFVGWLFQIPFLYRICFAGLMLGPLYAIVSILFFYERVGSDYIARMNQRQKEYEDYLKKMVKTGLHECKTLKGTEKYAFQGEKQFEDIIEKYNNVKELLEAKLRSSELTFGRFLGAAEQVSLNVLDNLKNVVNTIKSAGSIHPDYIKKQIEEISANTQIPKEDTALVETLQKRLDLYEKQRSKVKQLLAKNEEAMTEMEKISAAVAEWKTDGSFASTNYENAIKRLQDLADSALLYNNGE